jgi:hypothetical protein
MGPKKRSKSKTAKKGSNRHVNQTSPVAERPPRTSATEAACHLDQVIQTFDGAVDGLQNSLERLRATLPELVALGVHRDRLRGIKALADDGILDSLHRLATALENCNAAGDLPESLVPLHRSARMAIDHICRTFEVEAVYLPGESLTVMHEHFKDFDWSTDHSGELYFPADVEILRSGWKAGDIVFVLPRAVRRDRRTSA